MNNSSSPRVVVAALFFVIVAGLVMGAVAFGPYFVHEHQRFSIWQGILMWMGDACALFWVTVYFVRHTLMGVPLSGPQVSFGRGRALAYLTAASILVSLGGDLWITLQMRESEREAFAVAARTSGTIESATKHVFEKADVYKLQCTFTDANNVVHKTKFVVHDPDSFQRFPAAVQQAVRQGQFPCPVSIAYDVDRPERAWLLDLGWDDSNRITNFSLCVLLFQCIACFVFLVMLGGVRIQTGTLPWWYDLHAVVLVAAEAAWVILLGTLSLMIDGPLS